MNTPVTITDDDFEKKLATELSEIMTAHATGNLQRLFERLSKTLNVTPAQLAAAALLLDSTTRSACIKNYTRSAETDPPPPLVEVPIGGPLIRQLPGVLKPSELKPEKLKMVRYRLEVGYKHQVSIEDIKEVLINESGVERAKIGYTDMRSHYTLIDLPNGMPPDIFQHLQSVEVKQHMLQIKRVNNTRKRHWHRRKSAAKNQIREPESNPA